ncbi:hypothetical protein MSPP1_000336 [Malassezia sp. CBS 17886]|nr:hypothetical protein MSPP1_000336 [Malassezia sp. CBS 17886]
MHPHAARAWATAVLLAVVWAACTHAVVPRAHGIDAARTAAPAAPLRTQVAWSAPTAAASRRAADDSNGAAGGITITQPPQTADASFYKIAPHVSVTFGWSFTSLTKTPATLFVVASCSKNGYTYPIAPSPTGIPGDATNVTWYPYGYRLDAQANGQPDLAAANYRLTIYDENGQDSPAKGGEFSPNNVVEFALYYPEKYTPLAQWTCAACSGAAPRPSPAVLGIFASLLSAVLAGIWLVNASF